MSILTMLLYCKTRKDASALRNQSNVLKKRGKDQIFGFGINVSTRDVTPFGSRTDYKTHRGKEVKP